MRLDKSRYAINPVLCTRVFEKAGRKVGYFAYNSFVAPYKEQTPTTAKTKIDEVFRYFQEEGVSELIVDLRYNGGGSVSAAEYLTNLLVPSGNNGKIMYSYRLNPTLTSYTRKDESWKKAFQTVMVNKTNGTYYPVKVYFIVTKSTASASELLINNLKPYIDVILIGSDFTYGKPVGFFPISILNTDLYAVSFETLNSKGEGEYYGGLRTDKVQAEDLTRDWGDERESCLAQALFHVQYGTFKNEAAAVAGRSRTGPAAAGIYNIFLDRRGNKNMYMLDKGLRVPR
ncbi:S41 family peptidase [Arcticibacter sp. MXS-1]|uniref:S41 family peptidase n=1 Tax=Arcticibacter sp. MXS-1 TaxID=3341726 RepID=UPI0035A96857